MKNKEIEELLNNFQEVLDNPTTTDECYNGRIIEIDRSYDLEQDEIKLLLSYIEQLETDYEEAIESVTWWRNRFNAVKRDKKQLENNRDKAITLLEENVDWGEDMNSQKAIDILKGGSND